MGLLCSAKLGVRLPFTRGASTAWEGGTPAFFVVAGRARGRLLYFASAALSFESAAEETGRRELWLQTHLLTAPRAPFGRWRAIRENPCAARLALSVASAGIARQHIWCTRQ